MQLAIKSRALDDIVAIQGQLRRNDWTEGLPIVPPTAAVAVLDVWREATR